MRSKQVLFILLLNIKLAWLGCPLCYYICTPLSYVSLLSLTRGRKSRSCFDRFCFFSLWRITSHLRMYFKLHYITSKLSLGLPGDHHSKAIAAHAQKDARFKAKCLTVTNGIYFINILTWKYDIACAICVEWRAHTLISVSHVSICPTVL